MGGRGSSGANGATRSMSLAKVGQLQSGNEPGMTVAEEYQMKEVRGQYTENDYARAADYGQTPREYQASITKHIKEHGIINAAQYTSEDKTLAEGYHRYAAMRQLRRRSMPIRRVD